MWSYRCPPKPGETSSWRETAARKSTGSDANDALDEGWKDSEGVEIPVIRTDVEVDDLDPDDVSDPQLERACDMLRGILVFENQ